MATYVKQRQRWTDLQNGPDLQKPLNFAILRFTNQGEVRRKIAKSKGFCKFGPPKRKKTGLETVLKYFLRDRNAQH